jgi:hypothetical protein
MKEIYSQETINFFHKISPKVFKENHSEFMLRCPYCGDSKKDNSKTRLYISKKQPVFNCFNCGESGHIYKLFKDFKSLIYKNNIFDNDLTKNKIFNDNYDFSSFTSKESKYTIKYEKTKIKYNLNNDRDNITLEQKKYLKNRNINIDDIINDHYLNKKIIFNTNYFIESVINKFNDQSKLIQNDIGIGFLSYFNYLFNVRSLQNNDKFKYIKYKINTKKDYFVIINEKCNNDNVIFSEGPFDILKTYLYLKNEFDVKYYISIGSKKYEEAIKYFLINFKSLNNSYFLIDSDTNEGYYKYIIKKYKPFFVNMLVYMNSSGKDWGENKITPFMVYKKI